MEEDITELIEFVRPGDSQKFSGLDTLSISSKYLDALAPNPKRIRLYYRLVHQKSNLSPKASLCIVHGFAEHSGKFMAVAAYYALRGFLVHMIDLRSYGYSGGARGGSNLVEFQQDIAVMLSQVREDLPCFLWGHSMGGLLVTTLLINNPTLAISGAVISAPLFKTSSGEVGSVRQALLGLIAKGMKEAVFNSEINASCLSRDDVFLKCMYRDNKLIPLLGPGLGSSILEHMKYAHLNARMLKHPVIFYHGDADVLTIMSATQSIFKKSTSTDKTFKQLFGTYHEPHHDLDRDSFVEDTWNWISSKPTGKKIGKIGNIVTGLPGMPKKSRLFKVIVWIAILAYFVVAWKVKIGNEKLMRIFKVFSKLFWPLTMLVR